MVQTFQRYVPYSSVVNFLVQSLLCLTAFTFVVQVAWYAQLDPTLPSLAGVRLGRTVTTVATLVGVFYLTGYFERRNRELLCSSRASFRQSRCPPLRSPCCTCSSPR